MHKTVAIIGLIQALFGVLIFLSKRPQHISFKFLSLWMAVIAFFHGSGLLPFQVVEYFKPGIFPLLFLFGPLLYMYVKSLAVEKFSLSRKNLLHLLPLIIVSVHRTVAGPASISNIPDYSSPQYIYNKVYYTLVVLSFLIYWIFSLKLLLEHQRKIPFQFSNYTSRNSLRWLSFVLSLFLILFLADLVNSFLIRVLEIHIGRFSFLNLNLTIFTFIMTFFGINQNAIYKGKKDNAELILPENTESQMVKTMRAGLTEKQIVELNNMILKYLATQKPYLNPDYSLQMMADDLKVSRQKLSEVINQGQKKNFYKLINELRVTDVKEMLNNQKYSNYTVLGIGLECGFNSKTSFNRIFKEETGLTPSEYRKTV